MKIFTPLFFDIRLYFLLPRLGGLHTTFQDQCLKSSPGFSDFFGLEQTTRKGVIFREQKPMLDGLKGSENASF